MRRAGGRRAALTVRRLLAIGLVLASLASCSGFSGVFRVPEIHPQPRLQPEWQKVLHANPFLNYRPRQYAVPIVDRKAGTVIVGANDGVLFCYDVRNGAEQWRFRTDGPIWSGARIAGDHVYVGNANGTVYALHRETGEPIWDAPYQTEGAVASQPAFADGRLFITLDTNELQAIDAGAGDQLWSYRRDHRSAFTLDGQGAPVVAGDTVVTGFSDGMLVAVRVEDGTTVWQRSLAGDGSRFKDVDGGPVLVDGELFVSSNAGGVYAIAPRTGEVRWHHKTIGASRPAVSADTVYFTSLEDRVLGALDRGTGKLRWKSGFHRGTPSAPTVSGPYVFVSTTYVLMVADRSSGRMLERFSSAEGFTARSAAAGGRLFLLSNRGHLHALGVR